MMGKRQIDKTVKIMLTVVMFSFRQKGELQRVHLAYCRWTSIRLLVSANLAHRNRKEFKSSCFQEIQLFFIFQAQLLLKPTQPQKATVLQSILFYQNPEERMIPSHLFRAGQRLLLALSTTSQAHRYHSSVCPV